MKGLTRSDARGVAEALEGRICLSLPPLDPAFGVGGMIDTGMRYPGDFLRLPDEGFLVGGLKTQAFPAVQFSLSRLNPDGTYDDRFRADLFDETDSEFYTATDFALQPDGKIVVVGAVGGGPARTPFAIGRFNPDGTPDNTFAGDGVKVLHTPFPRPPWWPAENPHVAQFQAVAIQPDGKILAAGWSDVTVGAIARFTPDGELDPTFGNGGWAQPQQEMGFFDLALQPDGKIVAAGSRYEEDDLSSGDAAVIRLNPDGTLDPDFGNDGRVLIVPPVTGHNIRGHATAVVIGQDGRIFLGGGGETSPVDGQYEGFELFALESDGSLDREFGTGGRVATRFRVPGATTSYLSDLVLAPDGTLIAGGLLRVPPGPPGQFAVMAAYRPDGSPLRSFGTDGQIHVPEMYDVRGIQVLPDTSVLALGGSGHLAHFLSQPVVSVRADGLTTEIQIPSRPTFASSIGNLVFERSGDLSAPLEISYSVSGTATNGVDYVSLPGVVTFAAGQDMVTVPVTPIDDYLAEGTEDVTVTLADIAGYVTRARRAVVAISDNEGPDRFEPNNSLAQATRLTFDPSLSRTESKLSLHAAADQDYFSVTADNRGDITATVTFDDALGQLSLEAYDMAGNRIATAPVAEDRRQLVLRFEGRTQYYLRVSGAANPDYALEVKFRRRVDVVGRYAFYNRSAFDGGNPGATAADFTAIASDKAALLPGQTAGGNHVTSYSRGLNGIMIDVLGLPNFPQNAPAPPPADFAVRSLRAGDPAGWQVAARPASVTVFRGAGVGGSDRLALVWEDYGSDAPPAQQAVANGWMELAMLATPRTGLAAPDVFYFGNLIGETGDGASPLRVTALDLSAVKRAGNTNSPVTGRFDFNRDGRVNALDLAAVRSNLNRSIVVLTTPVPVASDEADRPADGLL